MLSRADILKSAYKTLRKATLDRGQGKIKKAILGFEEADVLFAELERLRGIPESHNLVEEAHLRFLSRLRMLTLGDFKITGYVGAGACGVVYRAVRRSKEMESAAIKILFMPRNGEETDRFSQEGDILNRLNHPAIVRGFTKTQTADFLPVRWFAMELVKGAESFEKKLKYEDFSRFQILADVCDALDHAHRNEIIHRDLHTENILIGSDGAVKVLDFGSAKLWNHLGTFRPVGNTRTAAPERFTDPSACSGASDIFSIGCIAYYALYKKWPFYSATYKEYIDRVCECRCDLPPTENRAARELIASILVANPKDRPSISDLKIKFGIC